MAWLRTGIEAFDEDVRAEASRALAEMLPTDFDNRELARAVLLETTSTRGDILAGFRMMQELLNKPIGVIAYVFQYLPDGRAVSWPSGFLQEVENAARQLGLPLLQPAEHVRGYSRGMAAALRSDLRHYSDEFVPYMAERIVDFCQNIRDGTRSSAAA
jgi:hypothetical protein